ncbi:aminoglycoside phosphotransferase family protein [Deinococcus apachensis]|uniref:aminoglycoside phosphotransferase family protein n=1 Tax=Deinococcus apachensis TaxID=309886 RepID=UPI00035FAC08|nr:aminoglycoside phosphotransferase family protein [Deinococcus apachensis]
MAQPVVRAYAESLGAPGRRWLDSLPRAVQQQCREWGLRLGEALPGGSRSYVCRVTTADGGRAVLKLALPEPILNTQIATLVAARGQGYVQVLAHDPGRGALLMEALGPPIEESLDDVPAVLPVLVGTLMQAWRGTAELARSLPEPSEHKAAGLLALVRDSVRQEEDPALHAVADQAVRYARERLAAHDPARQVLVHGDPHVGNLLPVEASRPGAETGHVFVDPEGFLCEPEYDLGVALRGWNGRLLASADPHSEVRAWCGAVARATGTEAEAVWQWAYLERVSTGLFLKRHGLTRVGAPFLEVARRLLPV